MLAGTALTRAFFPPPVSFTDSNGTVITMSVQEIIVHVQEQEQTILNLHVEMETNITTLIRQNDETHVQYTHLLDAKMETISELNDKLSRLESEQFNYLDNGDSLAMIDFLVQQNRMLHIDIEDYRREIEILRVNSISESNTHIRSNDVDGNSYELQPIVPIFLEDLQTFSFTTRSTGNEIYRWNRAGEPRERDNTGNHHDTGFGVFLRQGGGAFVGAEWIYASYHIEDRGFNRFEASYVLNFNSRDETANYVLRIYLDGEMIQSYTMTTGRLPLPLSVDVSNASVIGFRITRESNTGGPTNLALANARFY